MAHSHALDDPQARSRAGTLGVLPPDLLSRVLGAARLDELLRLARAGTYVCAALGGPFAGDALEAVVDSWAARPVVAGAAVTRPLLPIATAATGEDQSIARAGGPSLPLVLPFDGFGGNAWFAGWQDLDAVVAAADAVAGAAPPAPQWLRAWLDRALGPGREVAVVPKSSIASRIFRWSTTSDSEHASNSWADDDVRAFALELPPSVMASVFVASNPGLVRALHHLASVGQLVLLRHSAVTALERQTFDGESDVPVSCKALLQYFGVRSGFGADGNTGVPPPAVRRGARVADQRETSLVGFAGSPLELFVDRCTVQAFFQNVFLTPSPRFVTFLGLVKGDIATVPSLLGSRTAGEARDWVAVDLRTLPPDLVNATTMSGLFNHWPRLRFAALPTCMTILPDFSLADCPKLTSVVFPDQLESVFDMALRHCPQLRHVRLPRALRRVNDSFLAETGIRVLDLRVCGTLTSIGAGFASDCPALLAVYLPESLVGMGTFCLNRNPLLRVVDFGRSECASLKSITPGLLNSCTAIQTVKVPAGVTTVAPCCLNCDSLALLDLSQCTALTSVAKFVSNKPPSAVSVAPCVTVRLARSASRFADRFTQTFIGTGRVEVAGEDASAVG